MRKLSYAELISSAQVMISGLKGNVVEIARRGLDEAFIAEVETLRNNASNLNDEQERLKSMLKMKTTELDAAMAQMDDKVAEAKMVVKMDFPKDQWKEFGIQDKR